MKTIIANSISIILMGAAFLSIMGLLSGLMDGSMKDCTYKTYLSINPGYYIGCELTKERFNLE